MIEAIKTSRYIQISLGLNVLMLVMSFVSVTFFRFFNNTTWFVFLVLGVVVIFIFFVSIVSSVTYLFFGRVGLKFRFIPLVANLSMFILFPLVQQVGPLDMSSDAGDRSVPITFKCENGEKFVLQFINRSQIKITSGLQNLLLSEESGTNDITIYGDEKNALTFVSGYGELVIKTQRGESPLSTICKPL